MAIVTRIGKGSALTTSELDGNFTYLEGLVGGDTNKREVVFELLTEVDFPEITSGTLVVGKIYIVTYLEVGDNFSNVGYISAGVPFEATNTTPTVWSNGTPIIEIPDEVIKKCFL